MTRAALALALAPHDADGADSAASGDKTGDQAIGDKSGKSADKSAGRGHNLPTSPVSPSNSLEPGSRASLQRRADGRGERSMREGGEERMFGYQATALGLVRVAKFKATMQRRVAKVRA